MRSAAASPAGRSCAPWRPVLRRSAWTRSTSRTSAAPSARAVSGRVLRTPRVPAVRSGPTVCSVLGSGGPSAEVMRAEAATFILLTRTQSCCSLSLTYQLTFSLKHVPTKMALMSRDPAAVSRVQVSCFNHRRENLKNASYSWLWTLLVMFVMCSLSFFLSVSLLKSFDPSEESCISDPIS